MVGLVRSTDNGGTRHGGGGFGGNNDRGLP